MTSTSRYDEFHPFLFAQHAKSPYLEFDTFDKVNINMAAVLLCLGGKKIDLHYNMNSHFLQERDMNPT